MAKASNITKLKTEDQLPAEMMAQFEFDAGQGVSTAVEDNLVPFIGILQAQSPQVLKRNPKYVEGAEAADILLTSLNRYWKGETGILFQPCAFSQDYVEWKLRDNGGGFVGRHPQMPTTAKETPDAKDPNRKLWLMPSGTQIVHTRYHYGIILNGEDAQGEGAPLGLMQAVISLNSTGHTFSRTWMTQMNGLRLPNGKAAPARSRKWLLTSDPKSNQSGDWFGWKVADRGWITDLEQYDMGTALFQAIRDGSVRAAIPEQTQEDNPETPF